MPGLSSVLDIGRWALFSSQSAIEVTGNNIANVETPGYSRREILLEEAPSIDYAPGQLGTGVRATEVVRQFNSFVEGQYVAKSSDRSRWESLFENLQSAETVLNPSGGGKVNEALAAFWEHWQVLAQRPEDASAREALLGKTQNLISAMRIPRQDLENLGRQMDGFISQDVDEVNDILGKIADINLKIEQQLVPGRNNPNRLYDRRNQLVRDLAEKLDVKTIDNGGGDFIVTTRAGHTLIDGGESYRIELEGPQAFKSLTSTSTFGGEINFSGSSNDEYTLRVSENTTAGDGAIEFQVSTDGGASWLDETITYTDAAGPVSIPNSDVSFSFTANVDDGSDPLLVGDSFTIVPKKGLYWYKTTSDKVNITPMVEDSGQDNARRLVGGSLTGQFNFRDEHIGKYQEKLDAFAKGLIWEVNRIHSQGAGLEKLTETTGTYHVSDTTAALNSDTTGLHFRDKLQNGSMSFNIYNQATGDIVTYDGSGNFIGKSQIFNFDPTQHSLDEFVTQFNNTMPSDYISASEVNGKLQIEAEPGYEFVVGNDSTGTLAALGVNTYFQGAGADDIAVSTEVNRNVKRINAAHVNGAGEVNPGDNTTALDIAGLQSREISLETSFEGETTQTLQEFYNSLTANVGEDTAQVEYSRDFAQTLAEDLNKRQKSVSGVNLDEEMSNLIKYQHSYTAAAKLITTAEQMMNTLLSMKQ